MARRPFIFLALILLGLMPLVSAPATSAQTQYITFSKGVVNLGMTTDITVTAPGAGTYTAVVVEPDGSTLNFNYTFTAAGQTDTENFGNLTHGFMAAITQAGTYNVFLEQGSQVISSANFFATNKLNVSIDFVNGGLCDYVSGAERGVKIFPRFYITYASTGAPLNKSTSVQVTFTLPDNTKLNATYHRPTTEAPVSFGFYIGKFQPNWNYSAVGPWSLTAYITDGLGNNATYDYIGPPFALTPATLSTSVSLVNTGTNQAAGGFYDGENVMINATVTYPTNAEPVPGFVAPLDSAVRGGSVKALIGWGFFNTTSMTFTGTGGSGGLIATVPMTYSGSNGTWSADWKAANLPTISAGSTYEVVIQSSDSANPANTGLAIMQVAPATSPGGSTATTTTTTVSGAGGTVAGIDETTALLTAIATLIVGLIVGAVLRKTS